jgi:hypothetical protein
MARQRRVHFDVDQEAVIGRGGRVFDVRHLRPREGEVYSPPSRSAHDHRMALPLREIRSHRW